LLERVGLDSGYGRRYPHELSGGQCQRVAIARAMITKPKLVVCDEPFSALDVSVQAQIVNLFAELGRETGTALLVISHNLALVRHLCSRVMVLYLGRIMELAPREAIFGAPLHPYTRLLLDAVPRLGRAPRALAAGESASPFAPPSGCVFRTRCRHAIARCAAERPPLESKGPARQVACFRADEGVAAAIARD
jgi:oligopeptide/dipeptide ABC transporter ATP-binding protein